MKTQRELKQRAIWLATVSGVVLLSGCQTYSDFRKNFFGTRTAQEVETERRMPMMNTQYAGMMQPQLSPQQQPPQQMAMQQAPQPMTPYDRFDENGEPVDMMPMQPVPPQAPMAQPPMQQPPVAKEEPSWFERTFGSWGDDSAPSADYNTRKPIPGNPPMRASRHVVPHMMASHQEPAPVEPTPMVVQPMEQVRMVDGRVVGDMPQPPMTQPQVAESVMPEPILPEEEVTAPVMPPVNPPQPMMSFQTPPMPAPKGDLPLVEAMPLDPDELKTPGDAPVMPKPRVELQAEEQLVAMNDEGGMGGPFEETDASEEAQDVPPVIPAVPATKPKEVADEEIFMPQTDVQMEQGETVTVSSLEEKQKEEPSWFDRTFGAFDSDEPSQPKKRTWIERQLGFDDEKPVEQKQAYPNFSDVPPAPEQVEAMREGNQQKLREMESMRDVAQESRMELNSEPSSQTMVAMPEPEEAEVQQPVQPGQPQLLGHMTAADEPQAAHTTPPLAPAQDMTPLVGQASAPVEEKAPAMAEPMALQPVQEEPAQVADDQASDQGGVIFPDAIKARQEESQQMAEDEMTPPPAAAPVVAESPATVEQMASAKTASGLPSPKLLDQVQVLMPPSRYMNRRTQQSSQ